MDQLTLELRAIRHRLERGTRGIRWTLQADREFREREERWLALCPPDRREGHHLRLDDGRSHQAAFRRQTTDELHAERFTHAGLPDHSTVVFGLWDPGPRTVTRDEYYRLRG
jgi:hypothetical protein